MARSLRYLLVTALILPLTQADRAVPFTSPAAAMEIQTAQAAQTQQTPQNGFRVLTPQTEAQCNASVPASESADPPTTSAVSGRERFIARDHFRRSMLPTALVKITWLGATFTEHFLPKIETNPASPLLRIHTVQRIARDIEIIAELGAQHETTLADLWCLLVRQPNGEAGALRIDAQPNILYVRDTAGALRTVDTLWGGAGWELGASPAEGFRPAGSLVISR